MEETSTPECSPFTGAPPRRCSVKTSIRSAISGSNIAAASFASLSALTRLVSRFVPSPKSPSSSLFGMIDYFFGDRSENEERGAGGGGGKTVGANWAAPTIIKAHGGGGGAGIQIALKGGKRERKNRVCARARQGIMFSTPGRVTP